MGALLDRRALLAGLPLAAACSHSALAQPVATAWQHRMISSGNNRPAINLEADRFDEILAALHRRMPLTRIADDLQLTRSQLLGRIDRLTSEGVARSDCCNFAPTILVVDHTDAATSLRVEPAVVTSTAAAITRALPGIHDRYAALPGFTHVGFPAASLLVLSDCLLDNWQIDTVERDFLHKPRPRRRGGSYYYSIVEWLAGTALEPLGIYGNHSENVGRASIDLHGNRRYHGMPNLITVDATDRVRLFGFGLNVPRRAALGVLADDLVRRACDPAAATDP